MSRLLVRLAFLAALALLGASGAGFARASALALGDLAGGALSPSAFPGLLGPINELGRNGWQCLPERAAQAKGAAEAGLPAAERPDASTAADPR